MNKILRCSVCGKEITESEYNDNIPVMCDNIDCFRKYFWTNKIKLFNSGDKDYKSKVVIVNNVHYYAENYSKDKCLFMGHGGRLFTIKFNDGRIIKTNNLWCQGDIPKEYQKDLPNNAEFI